MRATYQAHVTRSRWFAVRASALRRTSPRARATICAAAAPLAIRMLDDARDALRQAKAAGDAEALAVRSFGISSAYRSALRQYRLWNDRFGGYVNDTAQKRAGLPGGPLSDEAAQWLAHWIGGWLAAPGFSNHNDGRANRPVPPPDQRESPHCRPGGHRRANQLAAPVAHRERRALRLPPVPEGAVALGAPSGIRVRHPRRARARPRESTPKPTVASSSPRDREPPPTGAASYISDSRETPSSRSSTGPPPSGPSSRPSSQPRTNPFHLPPRLVGQTPG